MLVSGLVFLGAAALAAASPPTEGSYNWFGKRSTPSSGGFALQATDCPVGASLCQSHWCCPNSLTCSTTNATTVDNVCCSGTDDCYNALVAAPVCADSSWGLFLATMTAPFNTDANVPTTGGQFCCAPGQIGTSNGECVAALGAGDQAASSIGPATATKSAATGSAQTKSTSTATTVTTGSSSSTTASGAAKSKASCTNTVSLSLLALSTVAAIFATIFA